MIDVEKGVVAIGDDVIDSIVRGGIINPNDKGKGVAGRADTNTASPSATEVDKILDSMSYDERLFHFTYATASQKMIFGEFGVLHRLNLISLQNELAGSRAAIWKNKSASEAERTKLRVTLREYAQAVRDYDYLRRMVPADVSEAEQWRDGLMGAFKDIVNEGNHPYSTIYRLLGESTDDQGIVERILRQVLPRSLYYKKQRADFQSVIQPERSILVAELRFILLILAIAIICATSLIAPMVIMSLGPSLTKSLVTTAVSVVVVAVILSVIRVERNDIIASTTAYAALLVVFVGAST